MPVGILWHVHLVRLLRPPGEMVVQDTWWASHCWQEGEMIHVLQAYIPRWKAWSKRSVNHQILVATLVVGGLTFLVHVATAAKELLTAFRFGTADELDAFLIAFLMPSFA